MMMTATTYVALGMTADGMTKVVDKSKFFLCRNFYMNIF